MKNKSQKVLYVKLPTKPENNKKTKSKTANMTKTIAEDSKASSDNKLDYKGIRLEKIRLLDDALNF